MTEAEIQEAIRLKALNIVEQTEKVLGNLYMHFSAFLTYEEQDYRDQKDNVERCMQMVAGQIMEAWTHAGRAKKRLENLKENQ